MRLVIAAAFPFSTSPKENPSGCPRPMQAKPILSILPRATALVRRPPEVGKQSATAIPCMARNMIKRARPHASTKAGKEETFRERYRVVADNIGDSPCG